MIKKVESYPELGDPQLQPRYSGIPTSFRLSARLDEVAKSDTAGPRPAAVKPPL
jgi:hypothetical protein